MIPSLVESVPSKGEVEDDDKECKLSCTSQKEQIPMSPFLGAVNQHEEKTKTEDNLVQVNNQNVEKGG